MPHCSIKWCGKNTRSSNKKTDGITFHRFPNKAKFKEKWINLTKRENWYPSKYSVVCSTHFTEDCFFMMKNSRRLLDSAVPTLSLPLLADKPDTSESGTSNSKESNPDTLLSSSPPALPNTSKRKIYTLQLKIPSDTSEFDLLHKNQIFRGVTDLSDPLQLNPDTLSSPMSTTPKSSKIKTVTIQPKTLSQSDAPVKKRLSRRVMELSNKVAQKNKQIKNLREKVRYYKKRDATLKVILKELDEKNLINSENADILKKIGVTIQNRKL